MNKKIVGILVCMLLIGTTIPILGKSIEQTSILINDLEESQETINIINSDKPCFLELPHEVKTLRHHLIKRNYLLYVPTSYTGDDPVPLVLVFHGGPNTPENASVRFGVSEKAEEEGFIVAYPNASEIMNNVWHFGLGWYTSSFFQEIGRWIVDEFGYTKKIISRTQRQYNIDPDRIYIAGHSNGAQMAYYLAARLSDKIAAIASNGGCIGAHIKDFEMVTIPEPKGPVSIAIFHGKLDYVVPYNGGWNSGNSVFYTSVEEAISLWVENNGCNPEPVTDDRENVTIDLYFDGDAGTEIIVYTLKYKGHIWFGGQPWEDPDPVISTTDEMWEFFKSHPKQ